MIKKYLLIGCSLALLLTGCCSNEKIITQETIRETLNVNTIKDKEITVSTNNQIEEETTIKEDNKVKEETINNELSKLDTKYSSANNIPNHLVLKVDCKEVDYSLNDSQFDLIYKFDIDAMQLTSYNDTYLEYKTDDIHLSMQYCMRVGYKPQDYGMDSKNCYALLNLKAMSDKLDTNQSIAGISVNSNVEEIYKLYGKTEKRFFNNNIKFYILKYTNVWLGNICCDLNFEIDFDLSIKNINVKINPCKIKEIEKTKAESAYVSKDVKNITPIEMYTLCTDLANAIIEVDFKGVKFDLNKITYTDLETVYKDVANFEEDKNSKSFSTGNKNLTRGYYNPKDNLWEYDVDDKDFADYSLCGLTSESTKEDAIKVFGEHYMESSGGILNDDSEYICYSYETADAKYWLQIEYSDATGKITGFSFDYN